MGYRDSLIGAVVGLIISIILMAFLLSEIGESLEITTKAIFQHCVPVLSCIVGAYMGYEYNN